MDLPELIRPAPARTPHIVTDEHLVDESKFDTLFAEYLPHVASLIGGALVVGFWIGTLAAGHLK